MAFTSGDAMVMSTTPAKAAQASSSSNGQGERAGLPKKLKTSTSSPPFGVKPDHDLTIGMQTTEIFERMLERQNRFRTYDPAARYLEYRRLLVDWMADIGCEKFGLQKSTVHVAVAFLDRILQQVQVPRERLQLVAICSVLIAGKFEEMESKVPTPWEMSDAVGRAYPPELITQMEILVLKRLEWQLTEYTALHFLSYFQHKGMVLEDDLVAPKNLPVTKKVVKYVARYNSFFAELTLQDYQFQGYPSAVLAAAILYCSRRALRVVPTWRDELEGLTKTTLAGIEPCATAIWALFQKQFPDALKRTQGQASKSPTDVASIGQA